MGYAMAPPHWDGDVADPPPPETGSSFTYVIIPNFVAVGQTVWAYVKGSKIWGRWGRAPIGWGRD